MLAILLLSVVPLDLPAHEEQCDWLELNHFYDCDGKHILSQWIFWDWTGYRRQVADWTEYKSSASWRTRDGVLFFSRHAQRPVRVRCGNYRETWTQFDPEVADRENLPEGVRRKIR